MNKRITAAPEDPLDRHTGARASARGAVRDVHDLALRRRLLPLSLLLGPAAALLAQLWGGEAWVWGWAVAWVLATGLRLILTLEAELALRAGRDARLIDRADMLLLAEPMLWAVLLWQWPKGASALGLATLAAASMLLAALDSPPRRALWGFTLALWLAVLGLGLALAWPAGVLLVLGLGVGVAWWVGYPRPAARPVVQAQAERRAGFRRALALMPVPVLMVREGRILELNALAAQCLRQPLERLRGSGLANWARVEPPELLEAAAAHQAGEGRLQLHKAEDAPGWRVELRPVQAGAGDAPMALALLPPRSTDPIDKAREFAQWCAGAAGLPWYCDAQGELQLPQEFAASELSVPEGFPLAPLLAEAVRAGVQARWDAARDAGLMFDETLELTDLQGERQPRRVTAICQAASPGRPVLGWIAPPPVGALPELAGAARLLSRLPVLVWLIDDSGRLILAQGADPQRWGLRADPHALPAWQEAFEFVDDSGKQVGAALAKAASGHAAFDVLHARTGRNGGRLLLRSHFIPYVGAGSQAVLVLDTIASPTEVMAVDRLKRSKAQYKALVEASTSLVWACDEKMHITFASRRAAREMYGRDPRELHGLPLAALAPVHLAQPALVKALADLRAGSRVRNLELVHENRRGQRVMVSMSAVPLRGPDGQFAGAIGMNADLTAVKLREGELAEALRVERTVLDSAGQAIAVVKRGRVERCNEAFLRLLGVSNEQLTHRPIEECFGNAEAWNDVRHAAEQSRDLDQAIVREVELRRGDVMAGTEGETAWCQLTARAIGEEEYVLVLADIDLIRRREQTARHAALHDELTGLPNRRHFAERVRSALAAIEMLGSNCALLAIDLDGFKQVNDSEGHEVGDRVLREVARRLATVVRGDDTVARRGGDEFAVLLRHVDTLDGVRAIIERLLHAVAQPILIEGREAAQVTASVGVALAPEQGREFDRLFQLADLAMYEAKLKGKNRYAFAQGAEVSPTSPPAARATARH
jgi:diguanylate cyclase (GGDEF)-like protein/PAS domain S-box-containing protein